MVKLSKRAPSVASNDAPDPFRDPTPEGVSPAVSVHSSTDSSQQEGRPFISDIPPAHVRASSSSEQRRQQQTRYVPIQYQEGPDAILPVLPLNRPPPPAVPKPKHGHQISAPDLVTRRPIPSPLDRRPENIAKGKRSISITKWIFIVILVCTNSFFIFATWWWQRYYYVFLPFITITVAMNCIMVVSCMFHTVFHRIKPEKEDIPDGPESMVMLLPCYNETREECVKSLDSLVDQVKIEAHKKAIMIICDGKARGPGMEMTTADYLLDDILATGKNTRECIPAAYTSWDHTEMDIVVQRGSYGGIPYICIVKESNRGKRDGLILIRSYLYNFNIRATRPAVIMSPYFFGILTSFLTVSAGFDRVDLLIGMDADTFFAPTCIYELIAQSHYKNTVGVCGYVAVDFSISSWSPWRMYQNSEYTISQCLRRLHQSIATHKVSCLPGCCQLLKVIESTCGDHIILDLFGYHPTPRDSLLKQIRATASEDRNHVCLMLSTFPRSQTRQALRARAYTDVPVSWSVFLSQRRRWTLGATTNDLFLLFAPGINWFERILALSNVTTWVLNLFIIACIASFIKACTFVSYQLILAFASVMMLPLLYYILIVIWQPRGFKERIQYLCGLFIYFFLGPFLNVIVLSYALWSLDNFAWGKTRRVVEIPSDAKEKPTEKPPAGPEALVRDQNAPVGAHAVHEAQVLHAARSHASMHAPHGRRNDEESRIGL